MIGNPFSDSAIETPKILAVTACQPLLGPPKQLAGGGADSPRKSILGWTVFGKGHYVNLRGGF